MSAHIPGLVRWGKSVVGTAMHGIAAWPTSAAESIVRGALRLVPESEADSFDAKDREPYFDSKPKTKQAPAAPQSRFVDAEEISWLESNRHELPYRRDKLWAVPQMWWEMTFGEVGSGTYLAGAAVGNTASMATGWAVSTVCKGILLWADLGRPDRVFRVFAKPNSSWISRGAIAYAGFTVAGGLSLLPVAKPVRTSAKVLASVCTTVLGTYDGLFLQRAKGVASWTDSSIPALFAVNGMAAGVHVANALVTDKRVSVASSIASMAGTGLGVLYARRLTEGSTAQRLSARDLLEGSQQDRFVGLGLGLGGVGAAAMALIPSSWSRSVASGFAVLGVAGMRRAILEAGIHAPVIDPPRGNINPIDHVEVSKGVSSNE